MEHSRLVEVHFYPCSKAVADVGARRELEHHGVGLARNQHPHVNLRQGCRLKGFEQALGGQEIWSFKIYAFLALAIALLNISEMLCHCPTGPLDNICTPTLPLLRLWNSEKFSPSSNWGNSINAQSEWNECSSPSTDGPVMRRCVSRHIPFCRRDIAVGNVHSAYISYTVVDYGYFAVVAPVHTCGEFRKGHLEERMDVDSGICHPHENFFFTPKQPTWS